MVSYAYHTYKMWYAKEKKLSKIFLSHAITKLGEGIKIEYLSDVQPYNPRCSSFTIFM